MDPEIVAILARFDLTTLDDPEALGQLPDARLGALQAELYALMSTRRADDGAEPAALARIADAVGTVLDAMETRPAIAASASRNVDVRVSRVAARRPEFTKPLDRVRPRSALVASGTRLEQHGSIGDIVAGALRDVARGGPTARQLFSIESTGALPTLGADALDNEPIIRAAASEQRQALRGSGGICAPTQVVYDSPIISTDARPVRDALVLFGVPRGGIRYMPPPTLADAAPGIGVWTEANDRTPADPVTKPIVPMDCPGELEVFVEAITARMRLGNFRARFWPESVTEWLKQLAAQHARIAEMQMVDAIVAESTAVTTGQLLGTTRDVLAVIDQAAAGYRSRQRTDADSPLVMIAPSWLSDMIGADLARQAPGDGTLAVSDAQINALFGARHVSVAWSIDWTAEHFATQAAGELVAWPTSCPVALFAPGTWLALDGGTLDFGIVRDSVLNQTNEAETFMESFEAVAKRGNDESSLAITMELCPTGETAGAGEPIVCLPVS